MSYLRFFKSKGIKWGTHIVFVLLLLFFLFDYIRSLYFLFSTISSDPAKLIIFRLPVVLAIIVLIIIQVIRRYFMKDYRYGYAIAIFFAIALYEIILQLFGIFTYGVEFSVAYDYLYKKVGLVIIMLLVFLIDNVTISVSKK